MHSNTDPSNLSTCKQCSEVIAYGADCIACEGFCKNVFHADCVKLKREDIMTYRQSLNFWWLCDQCIGPMRKHRNNRLIFNEKMPTAEPTTPKCADISRIDGELAVLKEQIVSLHQSLAQVTTSRVETSEVEEPKASRPLAQSSLLSLPEIEQSPKPVVGCCNSVAQERYPNDRFWIFMTRVKNNVTEQQIMKLVADSLGTEDAVVKKLVPPWKDTSSMPYVSFKVGVNERFKRIALLPATWPTGLCFREFRDYIWEPL